SLAGHVESTQAAAARQAGRDPAQTLAEWREAVSRTLALVAARGHDSHDGLDTCVALHGMQLPLRALLVVRAFELWVHENDIRLAAGQPLAVPGPSVLSLMTRLAATLLPGAAVRAGVPGPGRLHLVLTGPGGGTWDLEWDPERDPETASAARSGPAGVSIVADAVGFCRLVSDRMTPAELAPYITGDRDQAAGVLTAAATLALD
ncbi:MAG: maleylpyruvate isomerase family mycothiol-dependent enzyme, partial [Trebonia sp.]